MPIKNIEDLIDSLPKRNPELFTEVNANDHFELARLLHQLSPEGKIHVFNNLNSDLKRQEVLYETDLDSRLEIKGSLGSKGLAILLSSMPEDEATDIIQELGVDKQKEILSQMEVKDAVVIKDLITYKEETAGWLMVPKFNSVLEHQTAREILMRLKHENNLGISGNVGLQGSTVIVRGLATGDIQEDNILTVVRSELIVGIANGIIFGFLCGLIITLIAEPILQTSPLLGPAVGLGIVLAVGVAAVIGSTVPILFLRMNVDPAISSGPFVTVTNDVTGIAIYLLTTSYFYSAI